MSDHEIKQFGQLEEWIDALSNRQRVGILFGFWAVGVILYFIIFN